MATKKPPYTPDLFSDLSAFDSDAAREMFRETGWHCFENFLRALAVAASCSGPEARAEIVRLSRFDLRCAWNDHEKKNFTLQ